MRTQEKFRMGYVLNVFKSRIKPLRIWREKEYLFK